MRTNNNEVLQQLKEMKRWLAAGAVGFLLIGSGFFLIGLTAYSFSGAMEQEMSNREPTDEFNDEAAKLFQTGKADELLRLANERLQEFPNDANAYWYRARAYTLKKEWTEALTDLHQTAFLAPNWKTEYTDPLIAEVRQRMKAK